MGRQHVIAFSGGFDSTYMLFNFLNFGAMKHKFDKENDTLVIARIDHFNCGMPKNRREMHSRELIIHEFKKQHKDIKIKEINVSVHVDDSQVSRDNRYYGYTQPILWLCGIIPFLSKGDSLYIGYNSSDYGIDLVPRECKKIVKSFSKIQGFFSEDKITMEFPLLFFTKKEILFNLYNINSDVFEMCTNCESFTDTDNEFGFCGYCECCVEMKKALMELTLTAEKCKEDFAKTYLNKWFKIDPFIKTEKNVETIELNCTAENDIKKE